MNKTTSSRRPLTKKQKIQILTGAEYQIILLQTGEELLFPGVKLTQRDAELLLENSGKFEIVDGKLTKLYASCRCIIADATIATTLAELVA